MTIHKMRLYLFLLTSVFLIGSPAQSWADSDRSTHSGYLQQDVLFKNRTNIYDQSGRKKGYVQQDVLFKNTKKRRHKDLRSLVWSPSCIRMSGKCSKDVVVIPEGFVAGCSA